MRSDHDRNDDMRNQGDEHRDDDRNPNRMRSEDANLRGEYADENRMRGENWDQGRIRSQNREENRMNDDSDMRFGSRYDEGRGGRFGDRDDEDRGGRFGSRDDEGRGGRFEGRYESGRGAGGNRFGQEGSRFGNEGYGNAAYGTSSGFGDTYGYGGYGGYGGGSRYGEDARFGGERYGQGMRYDAYRYDRDRSRNEGDESGGGRGWIMAAAAATVAAVGGYALFRSATGNKHDRQGRSRWRGIHVEESVTINKPASEIYRHWSNLENLPSIMSHVQKVEDLGNGRTRWTADAPAGQTVTWEAETIQDLENERLTWRSVPGADVPNEGSVSFQERSGGRGTEVKVTLMYHPPGGALASGLATLFGKEPSQQVKEDLRRFKQTMESGEVMGDAHKRPSGRASGKDA